MKQNVNSINRVPRNKIVLRGTVAGQPVLSHTAHGIDFYTVPFSVPRKSGIADVLNVVVSHPAPELWQVGKWLTLRGEVHSYTQCNGADRRLTVTVRVTAAYPCAIEAGKNRLVLRGVVSTEPSYWCSATGRESCHLMLTVDRLFGPTDYLPCFVRGDLANLCGRMEAGTEVILEGMLQCRTFSKTSEEGVEERVVYEMSVVNLLGMGATLEEQYLQVLEERKSA